MESPSAQEGTLVMAQDDSSSANRRDLSTSSPESTVADQPDPEIQYLQPMQAVSKILNERLMEEKTLDQKIVIKSDEPNFTDLELNSRLSREESNDLTKCSDVSESLGSSSETMASEKNPENIELESRRCDSSVQSLAGHKTLEEIDRGMYDENLFSDEVLEASLGESAPFRKRQTPDFLPINAEIKRIGVEISEEQAKQLKNDVRRLSPVLVSLRERTLGEISLTSDSGRFDENNQALRLEIMEEKVAEAFIESSNVSKQLSLPAMPECSLEIDSTNQKAPSSEKDQCDNSASNHMENVLGSSSASAEEPLTKNDQCLGKHLQASECQSESPNTPLTELDCDASSTGSQCPNEQRELVIVLSRVDRDSPETSAKTKITVTGPTFNDDKSDQCENDSCGAARDKMADKEIDAPSTGLVDDETGNVETKCSESWRAAQGCDEIVNDNEERQQDENASGKMDRTIMSSDSLLLVDDICLSSKYRDNDQLRRKSPKVVLERALKDSTSPKENADRKGENDEDKQLRDNLDSVRRTLMDNLDDPEIETDDGLSGNPLVITDEVSARSDRAVSVTADLQESFDTETETETASDNSEVVSLTSIHSRDCVESTNDRSICPETDSVVSDETPRDMMTRLEPEGPEAFTEDSAESLAVTAGVGDEVRSDGSDSGLGSEIPGEAGIVPAPESDSETSFLDRIPDDILSDKDKAVNPLEAFAADPGTSAVQQEHQENLQSKQLPLPSFPSPPKSSLKRKLTNCMEGEPSAKRINVDDPMRKKRNIQFDAVTVYYFPRAQGFTCVPSQGGSTLGMSATHTHAERFSLTEHAAEQRRLHRARLAQLRSERAANCTTEAASSSEDPSDDTDEEPSDTEELDIDSYYFLQPVPTWQRRALLRAAGVRRIDAIEKDDCRDIRASREHCGCGCKDYCDPESCPCSRANVKCQVDRAGFPCGCSRDGCANTSGRIEFNPVRVRTHFIHTLMRLQLEKKQRDEDRTDRDLLMNNQIVRGPMREVMGDSLGPMEHSNPMSGDSVSCMNTGGFTTLHYETHDPTTTSCPTGVVHSAREDSLDLYAIRDDCYSADDVDGGPISQRKLHPEFGQVFQAFPGQQPAVTFPQSAYQDYQSYQALASTSRSQFQSQFQNVATANAAFNHYSYGHDAGVMQSSCQTHQTVSAHHSSVYETTGYSQEDPAGGTQQQYTNLNSVQPMNAVVQQIGKLEPFSELLASRYSYYGDPEPQPIPVSYHANTGQKMESDKSPIAEQHPEESHTDDCDENFGEIIKKSMVETVSA